MKVNAAGVANAKRLIAAGDVERTASWSFSAADGNKLLGPDGNDWANYAKWHLAEDMDAAEETKDRYKYPFGKNGKVYRRGVIAAKSRAAQQGDTAIAEAADALLTLIDAKQDVSNLCPECGAEMHEGECDECGYKKPRKPSADHGDGAPAHVNRLDVFMEDNDWMVRPFERTAEGYLQGRPIVTSIGVFQYMDANGQMHGEVRLPEEVFSPASLDSLKLKPLTNDHPNVLVEPKNVKDLAVGSLGSNPSWQDQAYGFQGVPTSEMTDGKHVAIDMIITDPEAISDVINGKRALSCGYSCDLEEKHGVYLGMPYDYVQRNIRYNHVAIVDKARAGDAAQIRMDSADAAVHIDNGRKADGQEDPMKVIKIDGVEYQAEAKVIETLTKVQEDNSRLDSENKQLKADKSTLEAERDTAKAKADKLEEESKNKMDASAIQTAIRQRRAIEKVATDAGIEFKEDQTDEDIKRLVIAKAFPKLSLDGKNAQYLSAAYDSAASSLVEDANADAREAGKGRLDMSQDRQDGTRSDAAAARQRMIDSYGKKEE